MRHAINVTFLNQWEDEIFASLQISETVTPVAARILFVTEDLTVSANLI